MHLERIARLEPGMRPGDHAPALVDVKAVLHWYGFLVGPGNADPDRFDTELDRETRFALQLYQSFYDLEPTGGLDESTIASLATPRCALTPFSMRAATPRCLESRTYTCRIVANATLREGATRAIDAWNAALEDSGIGVGFRVLAADEVDASADIEVASAGSGSFSNESWGFADLPLGCPDSSPGERRCFLNTDSGWSVAGSRGTKSSLYGFLHELGHVLGLGDRCADDSAMCNAVQNAIAMPSGADLDDLAELYGL